jgi:hypothetical protein
MSNNNQIPTTIIDHQLEELEEEPRFFSLYRVFEKIFDFFQYFKEVPKILSFLKKILTSKEEFLKFLKNSYERINNLPIVIFYKYLWQNKKGQLFYNIFVKK